MAPDPERIIIELRPAPAYLSNGQPWPLVQRLRQALKTLGRRYKLRATIIDEIPVTPDDAGTNPRPPKGGTP